MVSTEFRYFEGVIEGPVPHAFAFDCETDRVKGKQRNRLVQWCPLNANSLADVSVCYGWDAYVSFIKWLETTTHNIDATVYNIDFEWTYIYRSLIKLGYKSEYITPESDEFGKKPKKFPKKGHYTTFSDGNGTYRVAITFPNGKHISITDDSRRFGMTKMSLVAESIRHEYPEWWPMGEVKHNSEEVKPRLYKKGWLDKTSPHFDEALYYSALDAYSQAKITLYTTLNFQDEYLTITSWSYVDALCRQYDPLHRGIVDIKKTEGSYNTIKNLIRLHNSRCPPLSFELQAVFEGNMRGGYVFSKPGNYSGTFCHADFKSSYPYIYAYEALPVGIVTYRSPVWGEEQERKYSKNHIRYVDVEGDVVYGEKYMPLLTKRECGGKAGEINFIRKGHFHIVCPYEYLSLIEKTYTVSNLTINMNYVWASVKGLLKQAVLHYFSEKEDAPKHSISRLIAKLCLNGGLHGKHLTKTKRSMRCFMENGEILIHQLPQQEAEKCMIVGFTAMFKARIRLIEACNKLIDAGYSILMCDTDSFVCNTSWRNVEGILGKSAFVSFSETKEDKTKRLETMRDKDEIGKFQEKRMSCNLGRFEFEEDETDGTRDFEVFKTWCKKKYIELHNGNVRKCVCSGVDLTEENIRILKETPVGESFTVTVTRSDSKCEFGKQLFLQRTYEIHVIDPFDEYDYATHISGRDCKREQEIIEDLYKA